jgi:hypothetical protein
MSVDTAKHTPAGWRATELLVEQVARTSCWGMGGGCKLLGGEWASANQMAGGWLKANSCAIGTFA